MLFCYLFQKLMELRVERLVLPAVSSVLNTWTTSFGFSVMKESERVNFLDYTFLDFQGTIMCQKILQKNHSVVSSVLTGIWNLLSVVNKRWISVLQLKFKNSCRSPANSFWQYKQQRQCWLGWQYCCFRGIPSEASWGLCNSGPRIYGVCFLSLLSSLKGLKKRLTRAL